MSYEDEITPYGNDVDGWDVNVSSYDGRHQAKRVRIFGNDEVSKREGAEIRFVLMDEIASVSGVSAFTLTRDQAKALMVVLSLALAAGDKS